MAHPLLGTDLLVTPFYEADSWRTLDLTADPAQPIYPDEKVDLAVARDGDNLRQALILRLLTPEGSLTELGHPDYGSRLYTLIGQRNTRQTRLLARAHVLRAVAQERRVAEVLGLQVTPGGLDAPNTLNVELHVQPVGDGDPVTLGLEVSL